MTQPSLLLSLHRPNVCDAEFTYLSRQHSLAKSGYVLDLVRTRCQGFCWWCITLQHLIPTLCCAGKSTKSTLCNPALLTLRMFQWHNNFATFTGNVTCDTPVTQICLVITVFECLLGPSLSLFLPVSSSLLNIPCDIFNHRTQGSNSILSSKETYMISMLHKKTC